MICFCYFATKIISVPYFIHLPLCQSYQEVNDNEIIGKKTRFSEYPLEDVQYGIYLFIYLYVFKFCLNS